MTQTKTDLLGSLVRYINNLEKGNKTVVFMTALLISWKEMEVEEVAKIIDETQLACSVYDDVMNHEEETH